MPDLQDGETTEMQGSGSKPYILKNTGGVYSCSCPAWRNQSLSIEKRTCKHLRKLRGDAPEEARIGNPLSTPVRAAKDAPDKPALLLANVWDGIFDPEDWWMSEKLDGVRALWDAKKKQFITRLGNVYFAPDWFIKGLPNVDLDGELWMGRKMFQRCISIVRRQDKSKDWEAIRYLVFDEPSHGGPFEDRLASVNKKLQKHPYALVHEHQRCNGIGHLKDELAKVESIGGEGLMLRKPKSLYEPNRSMTLLKVKSFTDEDATVIGHEPGKGKHKGRLGALRVKLPNGVEFSVGTGLSDAERASPPAIGVLVKVKYQELTDGGVPRFPSYLGIRED